MGRGKNAGLAGTPGTDPDVRDYLIRGMRYAGERDAGKKVSYGNGQALLLTHLWLRYVLYQLYTACR